MNMHEKIWRNAYRIWRGAQKNTITFRFILWLKKIGVVAAVKSWLVDYHDAELRKNPSEGMQKSREYYTENEKRIPGFFVLKMV